MSDPLDILCAGRIYADLVFTGLDADPAPGREVYADGLRLAPGGGAYITAAYAAALGLRAGLFGRRPAAPFDACVIGGLKAGDMVAKRRAEPGDPQVTVAISGGGGDRAFVTRRTGPALPDAPPSRRAAPACRRVWRPRWRCPT